MNDRNRTRCRIADTMWSFQVSTERSAFTGTCDRAGQSVCILLLDKKTLPDFADTQARKRRYKGYRFWTRAYFVSRTGYNEQTVRRYIRNQEKADKASDFADLFNTSFQLIAKPPLAFLAQLSNLHLRWMEVMTVREMSCLLAWRG